MPHPFRRFALACALALPLAATAGCSKGDGGGPVGPEPSLTGTWRGSAKLGALDFVAQFRQVDANVVGTGAFSSPLGGDDFTAVGTSIGGQVRLTLTSSEYGVSTYNGRFVAADRVTGRLDAPQYSDLELTIDRQ
jgi:hypothetical protein